MHMLIIITHFNFQVKKKEKNWSQVLNHRNHHEALRQLGTVNHNFYEPMCERRLISVGEHSKSITCMAKYKVNYVI